jgi:DNA repair photolyase
LEKKALTSIIELLERKKKILRDLEDKLGADSRRRASEDHHAKRRPRPCGMTIHTGVGCSYSCAYCYIYDMGFTSNVKPYPLKPEEIVYALSLNPYVVPERTLAAYGSVTEPFQPETSNTAVEYMREIWKWLHLPSQVSTKAVLTDELITGIKSGDPDTNVLVTVITVSNRRLEPKAPDPIERIESASKALKKGLKVSLFIRPIIPGITDTELNRILEISADKGIKSAVLGSLRVTRRILRNLENCGADRKEIERRLLKTPRNNKQVEVKTSDLKNMIKKYAEEIGMKVFRAACEANTYFHGRYCAICSMGPCNTEMKKKGMLEESDVKETLEYLNVPYIDVKVNDNFIKIKVKKPKVNKYTMSIITTVTYRKVILLE